MYKRKTIDIALGIIFFGTLWGFFEVSLGGWLYSQDIAYPSIYLTAIAAFILAASKIIYPQMWTGTAIGSLAMLFKLANEPFFACHLLAIFLFGAGFDLSYALISRLYHGRFRLPVIGLIGTYAGRALFAVIITYVVRYHFWTDAGVSKVIDYIFITGTVSALIGSIAVPAGSSLAHSMQEFACLKLRPNLSTSMVLTASAGIWILQAAL